MAGSPTASASAAEATDGPVLSVVSKRLRAQALRKKYNRILQMEESFAAGKTLNREQEEVLRSKPVVSALIDELERLRAPLSSALAEELSSRPATSARGYLMRQYRISRWIAPQLHLMESHLLLEMSYLKGFATWGDLVRMRQGSSSNN